MSERRMRILIADDEPGARLLMQAALEKSGFDVCLADGGEDALRRFGAHPCDMAMLDVEMPGLNGYEVCRQLRQLAGDELPIVMVTGMDDLASVERAFDAGATDFIAKPINWALIGHRVRYLLRAHCVLQALHTANARNSAILSALPDTLLRLDAEGRVLDARTHAEHARNRQPPSAVNPLAAHFPADIAARLNAAAAGVRESGNPASLEIRLAGHDGQDRHFEARLASIDKQESLCLFRDITERKEAENRVSRLAYFDTLTGLPNRAFFSERVEREIERAARRKNGFVVFLVDLNGFKHINDSMGHEAGDKLLQSVADRLRQGLASFRGMTSTGLAEDEPELARLSGDEFAVLVPCPPHEDQALEIVGRMHDLMRPAFALEGREVVLTASIGIVRYPDDGENVAALLKHADTAMYHAKAQGRSNYQFYSASLTQEAMRRLDLESNLRLALERDEFILVYQPQLDLASGRIQSVEALIRWRHPQEGIVSPMEFIPAAEKNGLIVPIGEWVLRKACSDAVRWQTQGRRLRIAVNLSAVQFRNPHLASLVAEALRQTGLAAELLELEVTEGALMEETESTLRTLNALREAGTHLSLDDFGTGYSSLSYLKRLPLTNLKIDQSFVRELPADEDSLAIVRAIVALAKNMGFTTTAEGIETAEQACILRDLQCEILQGYFISKPVTVDALPALLERRWRIEPADTGVPSMSAAT